MSELLKLTQPVEIIVGTYEEFLIGYQLQNNKGKYTFEQSFTNHAHSGSIRSVASSKEFVASGGADEVVRLFSLKKRHEVGSLVQQEGTITDIEFHENSHLFTGSEDGTICVWDTRSWECLKTLRGHKKAITSISVHPSAKLLLSVSKDKSLRTWNMVKGRAAYVTNLHVVADIVQWAPNGINFLVVVDKRVDIYEVAVGGISHSFEFEKRINSIAFLTDNVLALAGDCESIEFYDINEKKSIKKFKAHDNRIKGLVSSFTRNSQEIEGMDCWLFSGSSDSKIKLWKLDTNDLSKEPELLSSVDTTCRLTCLSVWMPPLGNKRYQPRKRRSTQVQLIPDSDVDGQVSIISTKTTVDEELTPAATTDSSKKRKKTRTKASKRAKSNAS